MNESDLGNMQFIMTKINDGELNEWLDSLDMDDLEYTLDLLKMVLQSKQAFLNSL